jgi:thioredoxin reductase (NADPH)
MANELLERRREQVFPKLTPEQLGRIEMHGRRRRTRSGEVLVEPGRPHQALLVVLSGTLEIALPGMRGEELISVLVAGDFTGEMSTLRGVPGFTRIRVRENGEVLQVEEDRLRDLVQTDAELSELLMRAFILRRMGLVSAGQADAMLVGSSHSADTLALQRFLTRNAYPFVNVDVDTQPEVQETLDRFHLTIDELPVLIGRCGRVFSNPSIEQVAAFLQMNPDIDYEAIHDVVVIGAGPAGLAAAVYAASEGLDVLVIEASAPGGQAGTSSRIENYLGFPTGISGQALAGRALVQSQKFGAKVNIASRATRLLCDRRPYRIELSDGQAVRASTVIIATGAKYRELNLENLPRFIGAGIHHAATHLEAKLCEGEEIAIVGGGNSAGQAAVFLAGSCRHVHILVRAEGLAESMSRYLIRRIDDNPRITLHTRTELTALEGDVQLEGVVWRVASDGRVERRSIRHVFLMTGASPNTGWLNGCVALDDKAFVRTGPDLRPAELAAAGWPLPRAPHLLETSMPGVFAVGDVRSGSVKRIASAVGEGSICVQFVHRVVREISVASALPAAPESLHERIDRSPCQETHAAARTASSSSSLSSS